MGSFWCRCEKYSALMDRGKLMCVHTQRNKSGSYCIRLRMMSAGIWSTVQLEDVQKIRLSHHLTWIMHAIQSFCGLLQTQNDGKYSTKIQKQNAFLTFDCNTFVVNPTMLVMFRSVLIIFDNRLYCTDKFSTLNPSTRAVPYQEFLSVCIRDLEFSPEMQ